MRSYQSNDCELYSQSTTTTGSSTFGEEIDKLYTEILYKVKHKEKTRDILAGLLLVSSDAYQNEILSILEIFFELPQDSAYCALNHLHSVLDIRKNREGIGINTQYVVHIHRKSFIDLLTARTCPKVCLHRCRGLSRSSGHWVHTNSHAPERTCSPTVVLT